ncbi:Vacuolar protein sorting protein (Vps36) [Penicillium chrysogenum]|nr:Vacuolar protein sorting protein (Vps36) [Penicillium chrysogenum]
MASAKQIVALAETLARESGMTTNESSPETSAVLSESAAALGMVTTKDMLNSGSESLYLSELARDLAEYLTDDRKGILQREGGIMSLIDLWAVFNRSRNGVELASPSDFQKAAELWEKLKLPVRLRRFKSGLLVVQRYDWNDEKTIEKIQAWMEELQRVPPDDPVPWDWSLFGRAVTAQEAAHRFKWSVGVAAEELEMAEDRGGSLPRRRNRGSPLLAQLYLVLRIRGSLPPYYLRLYDVIAMYIQCCTHPTGL